MLFTWKWAGAFLEKTLWLPSAHLQKWPLSDKPWGFGEHLCSAGPELC